MDDRMMRKPQDVDRWSDEVDRDAPADPITGPGDRWVNEAARPEDTGEVAGGGIEGRETRPDDDAVDPETPR
ncbi:MAG: hypothetical protein ACJ77B_05000 [Chloroflexota bacterium]